jgi:hypothetical protein
VGYIGVATFYGTPGIPEGMAAWHFPPSERKRLVWNNANSLGKLAAYGSVVLRGRDMAIFVVVTNAKS